ncbi:MAG: mannose-1-phosphate guanylyltransferase [Bacteroidales bacterium]|jgi:mannose-1-phosphate guanylyltransferase|nr:mannose-1-phosphate guanylyltransferase [Bacteroidales bacterium]
MADKGNFCVIMAGGAGERFWPMSRKSCPKQFIDILGNGKSLLQKTVERMQRVCPLENIYIVTNEIYYQLTKEKIPQLSDNQIILESVRRNTAPCIAYANAKIKKRNPNANIVVTPADHIIIDEDSFVEHLNAALNCTAKNPWLLTLGIQPTRPDTGYGYIQFDEFSRYVPEQRITKVKLFAEKPALELAQQFIESGDFLWNAGIFVWRLPIIEKAFELHLPEMKDLFDGVAYAMDTPEEKSKMKEIYQQCTSISIDYAIMEKADNAHVLISDFGWSDLGTWTSLFEHLPHDENGNAIQSKRDVFTYQSTNCIINTPKDKIVVVQGLEDYIVAEHDGVLLICKKTDEQEIRRYVNDVELRKGEKFT